MERALRLRKGEEFDRVYREGAVTTGPFFVFRALPNSLGHARWGFAVGKGLSKRAVVRNRVKRRLREAVRTTVHGRVGGYDIVVTARGRSVEASFSMLVGAFGQQVGRASVLAEGQAP